MSIRISALQRNAAEVVRRVAASGKAEEITDRGRIVAVISPPPAITGLERLKAAGLVRPPEPGALARGLDMSRPLPAVDLMGALAEQRDTDR